jgi:LAS superfamily LD-carboxypeptidase LdcB
MRQPQKSSRDYIYDREPTRAGRASASIESQPARRDAGRTSAQRKPAARPTSSRSAQIPRKRSAAHTVNPHRGKPQARRPAARKNPPKNHAPRGAVSVFLASIALIVVLFSISYSISAPYREARIADAKRFENLPTPVTQTAPATVEPTQAATPEPTAAPQATAEPTSIPIVIDLTKNEYATNQSGALLPAAPDVPEDIPYEGFQETIVGMPQETYITIDDILYESNERSALNDSLPLLVNSAHRLSEDWKPADLVFMAEYCPSTLMRIKGAQIQGDRAAVDALIEMFSQAASEGVSGWQVSAGYRSWAYQQSVFNDQVYEYQKLESLSYAKAIEKARQYVAEPGASEHHTGLAFDITVPGRTFASTEQCKWLAANCWKFGFIVRYAEDKVRLTGIAAEPWHIRYVGLDAADMMAENNWCLEEYIAAMSGGL